MVQKNKDIKLSQKSKQRFELVKLARESKVNRFKQLSWIL